MPIALTWHATRIQGYQAGGARGTQHTTRFPHRTYSAHYQVVSALLELTGQPAPMAIGPNAVAAAALEAEHTSTHPPAGGAEPRDQLRVHRHARGGRAAACLALPHVPQAHAAIKVACASAEGEGGGLAALHWEAMEC